MFGLTNRVATIARNIISVVAFLTAAVRAPYEPVATTRRLAGAAVGRVVGARIVVRVISVVAPLARVHRAVTALGQLAIGPTGIGIRIGIGRAVVTLGPQHKTIWYEIEILKPR